MVEMSPRSVSSGMAALKQWRARLELLEPPGGAEVCAVCSLRNVWWKGRNADGRVR